MALLRIQLRALNTIIECRPSPEPSAQGVPIAMLLEEIDEMAALPSGNASRPVCIREALGVGTFA